MQKHCSKLPAIPTSWRRNWLLQRAALWSQKLDFTHMLHCWCRPVDFLRSLGIGSSTLCVLSSCQGAQPSLSRQVSSRTPACFSERQPQFSRRLATPDSAENLCCVAETTISKGLGGLRETTVRRPGACTPLSCRYTHRVAISNHRLISFLMGRSPFVGAIPPTTTNRS